MKTKIKNLICSLAIIIAIMLSSNFSLALCAINSFKKLSLAEYAPKEFLSYEFDEEKYWSPDRSDNLDFKTSFSGSKIKFDLSDQSISTKPSTMYDGTSTTAPDQTLTSAKDFYVMMLKANSSATSASVPKLDSKGKQVYETDANGDFVFKAEEVEESDSVKNNKDLYVLNEETGKYKEKIPVYETVNTTYAWKSNTAELKANSFYVVTAWVYTDAGSMASINLKGTDFNAEIKNIETNATWKKYCLFISTSSDEKNNVNIYFYYGNDESIVKTPGSTATATGAVYLDALTIQTISETDYNDRTINGEVPTNATVDYYSARYDVNVPAINGNFQNDLVTYDKMYGEDDYNSAEANSKYQFYINQYSDENNTEKLTDKQLENLHNAYNGKLTPPSIVIESEVFEEDVLDEKGNPTYDEDQNKITRPINTFNPSNKILKIENKSEKYSLGLLSPSINVNQFGFYRVSVFVKGQKITDTATIKLISPIKTGTQSVEGALQDAVQTVDTYEINSDITNNWVEVVFYVQGSCYYNTQMQVALLADTESTVYFDELRVENVSSSTYKNISSSDKKLDLSPTTTVMQRGISNGYFNFIDSTDVFAEMPYSPKNWSKIESASEDVVAGIVPTATTFYSECVAKIGNPSNPIPASEYMPNVLAMYADQDGKAETYGYKSSSFSLSASSVYKISFEVYAASQNNANFSGKVFANLIYADKEIAQFSTTIEDGDKDEWKKYTIIVRTGTNSRQCNIEIGVKDALGTAFFRSVGYIKLSDKTTGSKDTVDTQYANYEKQYATAELQQENRVKFVDFDGNAFSMRSNELAEGKNYYTSLSHSLKTAGKDEEPIVQGELGIVDTTTNEALYNNPEVASKFAMMINNSEEYHTVVNPNNVTKLSSSSFYEITLYVKTSNIPEGSGLTIKMNEISARFSNINTEENNYGDLSETNGYKKFTVLVRTGSSEISSLKISYELGSAENKTTGLALISGLNVKKLNSEKTFEELQAAVEANDKTTIVKDFSVKTDKATKTDADADNLTLATLFLVLSSILLVAVLILALIVIYIKKHPKHKASVGTNKANLQSKSNETPTDGFV